MDGVVLITGHSGFLGTHLVGRLLKLDGTTVLGLARVASSPPQPGLTGLVGGMDDVDLLRRIFRKHPITAVVHLAAQSIVPQALQKPVATLEANTQGTWNLLEAMREEGSKAVFVLSSTDAVYGETGDQTAVEDSELRGTHPYAVSKICAERIARSYAATYGIPVSIARFSNLYGPGECNKDRLIPGMIDLLMRGERPRLRSDGKAVRDFLYVDDAVDALMRLIKFTADAGLPEGAIFNLGSEQPATVLDVVSTIVDLMGASGLEPEVLNQASGEIRAVRSSSAAAREQLRWKPKMGLRSGLRETISWHRATAAS